MVTRPCKLQDPEKVQEIVDNYFAEREAEQEVRELKNGDKRVYRIPPSIYSLASKLGLTRQAFYDYIDQSNTSEAYNKEIINILTDAKERIIEELTEGVLLGYWNERVVMAQLQKFGVIGSDVNNHDVKVIIQGSSEWGK